MRNDRFLEKVFWFLQDGDTYTRRIGGKGSIESNQYAIFQEYKH